MLGLPLGANEPGQIFEREFIGRRIGCQLFVGRARRAWTSASMVADKLGAFGMPIVVFAENLQSGQISGGPLATIDALC